MAPFPTALAGYETDIEVHGGNMSLSSWGWRGRATLAGKKVWLRRDLLCTMYYVTIWLVYLHPGSVEYRGGT